MLFRRLAPSNVVSISDSSRMLLSVLLVVSLLVLVRRPEADDSPFVAVLLVLLLSRDSSISEMFRVREVPTAVSVSNVPSIVSSLPVRSPIGEGVATKGLLSMGLQSISLMPDPGC